MTSNVCPFCGGEVKLRDVEWCGHSWAGFVGCAMNSSHQIYVTLPKMYHAGSSETEIAQAFFHAFCHPAHLTRGMVEKAVIDVQVLKEVRQIVAGTCPDCDGDEYCRDECDGKCPWIELTAAIEAAKSDVQAPICQPKPGMVMVSVEDANLLVERCTSYYCDDKRHIDAVNRLTAAIDAAKGEKA